MTATDELQSRPDGLVPSEPAVASTAGVWRHPARLAGREIYLSWRFIRSNFPPSVVPGVIFTISAWHVSDAPPGRLFLALPAALVYMWLFIYVHELPNQAEGAAEDAVNKPHRPIPSGLCTVREARMRRMPVAVAYLTVSAVIGPPAVAASAVWLVSVVVQHYGHGHRWWPSKALHTVVGTAVGLTTTWLAGAGAITAEGWGWITAGAAYWTGVGFLQDQRDVQGDALLGRRTLPLVIGQRATRLLGTAFLSVLPLSLLVPLSVWGGRYAVVTTAGAAFTFACWYLAWRLMRHHDKSANDLTYKLYAALTCALTAGPLLT